MTRARQYDLKAETTEKSFITLFKKHGFETYWIGQNNIFSYDSTSITALALEAKNRYFRNELDIAYEHTNDNHILPIIKHILPQSQRTMMVINGRGSKAPYRYRYPHTYNIFKTDCRDIDQTQCQLETKINQYDNSILYTDNFISQIINTLKNSNAIILYTSDHGESLNPDDDITQKLTKERYVPLILWTSDTFNERNKKILEHLDYNTNQSLTHQNIFHSILDCAGLSGDLIDTSKSICNIMPKPHRKPTKSEIWLEVNNHDINDLKNKITDGNYDGLKLPLQLISGQGIYLYSDDNKNKNLTSLQEFLIYQGADTNYLLNINNMNEKNVMEVKQYLGIILNSLNIKERMYIESHNLKALKILKDNLSDIKIVAKINHFSKYEKKIQQSIFKKIENLNISHISINKRYLNRNIADTFLDYKIFSSLVNSKEERNKFEKLGIDILLTNGLRDKHQSPTDSNQENKNDATE